MNATKPGTPTDSPVKQEFVSNKNIVEIRTTFSNNVALANATAQRAKLQTSLTRNMCKAERLSYIKRGVVFRNVFSNPDAAGGFSFIIDERACASLEKPVIADFPTSLTIALKSVRRRQPWDKDRR